MNPPNGGVKNVVRDLIYGAWCSGRRIGGTTTPPLNLLYIATVLSVRGHNAELVDAMGTGMTMDELKPMAGRFDAAIVSMSTMSFREDAAVLAELKKENPSLKTIAFGSHPTFMPEHCLSDGAIDIAVMSEPEFIIRDLIGAMESPGDAWKSTKGIGYMENGRPVINERYPFIEDLDELPFPDRTMLPEGVDYFNPLVKRTPYATMMTSRGCSAPCNFCTVRAFYGNKTRTRSVDNILEELEIIKAQGYREVFFRDEMFTLFKARNKQVCEEMIRRKLDLTWIANARVGTVDRETALLMKKAGCHLIKYGVETGDQRILDNINKRTTLEAAVETFRLMHEIGIDTHAHMMLGCPGESADSLKRTMRFVREIDPSTVTFGICTPYPGSELFDRLFLEHPEIRDGSGRDLSSIHVSSYYNRYFTDTTEEQINAALKQAYRSFYMRPSYMLRRARRIDSVDELMRVVIAGANVLSFSMEQGS